VKETQLVSATDRSVPAPQSGGDDIGLVDALAQLTFVVHGALGRIVAAQDQSIVQARLLGILRDRTPSINDLAEFLQLDKSSVSGLVDRAQERGLVTRTPSTTDRRSVRVSITAAGQEMVKRVQAAFEADVEVLVADLSSVQRAQLSRAASIVVAADARRCGIDIFNVDRPPLHRAVLREGR
jgi:MarR family transcriptional regulator, lower aerobic nicotinate degradation pathway regulator